ncbi:MAG TPA: YrhA family protein [Tepidisphaeraceae bacterium]|nr:YrhA family protein [Tepidisphaeraceae bacterium]
MVTLEDAVEAVRRQLAPWGLRLQPPCEKEEIGRLRRACKEAFGVAPPERYLDLLRITNGFWENGLHVYASQISSLVPPSNVHVNGVVEATRMYREDFGGYFAEMLVFAEDDAYVYAYHVPTGRYRKQAYVEPEPTGVFETFDELFASALETVLREGQ